MTTIAGLTPVSGKSIQRIPLPSHRAPPEVTKSGPLTDRKGRPIGDYALDSSVEGHLVTVEYNRRRDRDNTAKADILESRATV